MMDLQKVKEALSRAYDALDFFVGSDSDYKYDLDCIKEALVELEKPVDDDLDLESVVQCIGEDAEVAYEASDFDGKPDYYVQLDECRAKEHIQQYTESYHAKKCAECDPIHRCPSCGVYFDSIQCSEYPIDTD